MHMPRALTLVRCARRKRIKRCYITVDIQLFRHRICYTTQICNTLVASDRQLHHHFTSVHRKYVSTFARPQGVIMMKIMVPGENQCSVLKRSAQYSFT